MKLRDATCPFCGKPGRETDDDPAPGVCPECLETRCHAATERFAARVVRTGTARELLAALAESVADLAASAGMRPEAADLFLRGLLARAFGDRLELIQ